MTDFKNGSSQQRRNIRSPVSTYRLQFSRDFRFVDALKILEYLHQLGITDVYASPILKARPGSTHGYDAVDPTQLNPEIGSMADFAELTKSLRERHMGLLLDIVPNHMAASLDNPWWFDILEKGEGSPYASFFDVNWESKKVLLPILNCPYGEALEQAELQFRIEQGRAVIQYHDQLLPVAAGAENLRLPIRNLDEVLSRQHYRLAHWRKAADAINYRRFFDISDLVALRSERDEVFKATHQYVLTLIESGHVQGLRIDHVDGLWDPKGYLDRLPDIYVVVEKILSGAETLPGDWRVSGTTGYDFLNFVNGAFIDRTGFLSLQRTYAEFTGSPATFTEIFRERKRQVMQQLFPGDVEALVRRLAPLAEEDRHARDLHVEELKQALLEVSASLPVYRTYIRELYISSIDRSHIEDALMTAGKGPAYDFLRRVLLLDPPWYLQQRRSQYLDFVMRWQQFTGAVMAKGLEDTTFYVHNPLLSVNEVGGNPNGPEMYFGVEEFHRRNSARHACWPQSMNATSTHDTKRSEDVRARINVLSEFPLEWARCLRRWTSMNGDPVVPDRNEQIHIYQSMLGAWPIDAYRLKQYVTKALREAKTHTNWIDINHDYESRVLAFVDSLYSNDAFLRDFGRLQKKMAYFGALSSLSQVVLKITSPGIPDFYRGTETWDFSLADPDNRRPVDFAMRAEILRQLQKRAGPEDLLKKWEDGRIKMFATWKTLTFRRSHADLFLRGEYIPLRVSGVHQNHIIAFARRMQDSWTIVAVPRLLGKLTRAGSPPLGEKVWQDTTVELPPVAPSKWTEILFNNDLSPPLTAASLFRTFPVALLFAL